MSNEFDPDKYLKESSNQFDPDLYLSEENPEMASNIENKPLEKQKPEIPGITVPIGTEVIRRSIENLPKNLESVSKAAEDYADIAAFNKYARTAPKETMNLLKQELGIGPGVVEPKDVGRFIRENDLLNKDIKFLGGTDTNVIGDTIEKVRDIRKSKGEEIGKFLETIPGEHKPKDIQQYISDLYKKTQNPSVLTEDKTLKKFTNELETIDSDKPLSLKEVHGEKSKIKKDTDYNIMPESQKFKAGAIDSYIIDQIKKQPDHVELLEKYNRLKKEAGVASAAQQLIEEHGIKGGKLGLVEKGLGAGSFFNPKIAALLGMSRLEKMYGDIIKSKIAGKIAKTASSIAEVPTVKMAAKYAGKPIAKSLPILGMAATIADARAEGASIPETALLTAAGEIPGVDFIPTKTQLEYIRKVQEEMAPEKREEFSPEEIASGSLRPYGFEDGGIANLLDTYKAEKQATEVVKPTDVEKAQEDFIKAQTPALKHTSDLGKEFIKSQEGFSSKPKWDYKQHSYGYGTKYEPGMPTELTEEQASELFAKKLGTYEQMANQLIGDKPVPQETYDAIVSYLYNTGNNALRKKSGEESEFSKYAKSGDWENAINEMDIVTASGKRLPGLEKRRRMERDLARQGLFSQLRNKVVVK